MRSWFLTFPGGWAAVALVLLRLIVGVSAAVQGFFCWAQASSLVSYLTAAILVVSGLCVLVGFATPVTSVVVACCMLALAASWLALPAQKVFDSKQAVLEYVAIAVSIAMLGPGMYSLDARLFGRREIIIPPVQRSDRR